MSRVAPPGGQAPPAATSGGVSLEPLAQRVAERYFAEFPDDLERYGAAARAWEVHDTQWALSWAASPAVDLERQTAWLARVLAARDFPLERLARNLELAADVCAEVLPDAAPRLRGAAERVRAHA
jgi:hypothetical protein